MHISEGVLSPGVLVAGAALSAVGVAAGLRRLDNEQIPSVGILSAAFFVGSLVRVPVGPASVHLTLNGLLGFLLGWKAFPAILVGLTLQALLFQFGGVTTLGVNTLVMALPAVMCHYLFGWAMKRDTRQFVLSLTAFSCGGCAVFASGLLLAFSLYLTGEAFLPAAGVVVVAHVPVMLVEGVLTATCVLFLRRVKPDLLEGCFEPKRALQ
ncbi:MAG: cobalt transporter CbiM [Thermodesulfobacteriota bacterium]|nr:cobalt transporter CbiM [Thermodesulfobacteriota bacterium]